MCACVMCLCGCVRAFVWSGRACEAYGAGAFCVVARAVAARRVVVTRVVRPGLVCHVVALTRWVGGWCLCAGAGSVCGGVDGGSEVR